MSGTVVVKRLRQRVAVEPDPATRRYWDIAECCAALGGITRQTLGVYRRHHGLPTIVIPGANKPLFDPEAVHAWLKGFEVRECADDAPTPLRRVS